MILDADLTVPPEDLPKFYAAHRQRQGRVRQRLAPGLSDGAARRCASLNLHRQPLLRLALFSCLVNQRFNDTLCGTKVLSRDDYERDRARAAAISATSIRSAISI